MAAMLWSHKVQIPLPQSVIGELKHVHSLIANPSYKWEMQIGHVIPRDPQFTSIGDACLTAGGAFCDELEFWFDIFWSQKTKQAIADKTIHINVMEFTIVSHPSARRRHYNHGRAQPPANKCQKIPNGIPSLAKLLIRTDNSPSQNWAHKVSSRSEKGQHIVHIYAALLNRTPLAVACNHISGKTNSLADFISRPPNNLPSPAFRHQQILAKAPKLASYCYFRPHPEFVSNLESRLFSEEWKATTTLPKSLGLLEAAGSTTSSLSRSELG